MTASSFVNEAQRSIYNGLPPSVVNADSMSFGDLTTKLPRPSYANVRDLIIKGYPTVSATLFTASTEFDSRAYDSGVGIKYIERCFFCRNLSCIVRIVNREGLNMSLF